MAFNFSDLKKSQGNLEKINQAAAALNKTSYSEDNRYWRPVLDKGGEGSAIIRFLPGPGEEVPFVRLYTHSFKNEKTGQWFIENSLTTLELPDPLAELNSKYWNSGTEEGKEIARKQKRKLNYISNILVVRHKARPEDEGKQYLFKYGAKVFAKLQGMMNPDDEDEKAINPFCLFTGANFKLKIKKVAGFPNYDDSSFDFPSPAADSDAKLEALWKNAHSLQAEVAPDRFKSYADLEKRLNKVLGIDGQPVSSRSDPVKEAVSAPSTAAQFEAAKKEAPKTASSNDDSDDNLDWLTDLTA